MDDPYHGSDGFGNSNHDQEPDLSNVQSEHAVQALVRLVKENPRRYWKSTWWLVICFFWWKISLGDIILIALGPLTNVAMAMRLDDQFASNLKELYIMGGNVEGIGLTCLNLTKMKGLQLFILLCRNRKHYRVSRVQLPLRSGSGLYCFGKHQMSNLHRKLGTLLAQSQTRLGNSILSKRVFIDQMNFRSTGVADQRLRRCW